jgi:hypothetical protein
LKFGIRILTKILLQERGAKVVMPTPETIQQFMDIMEDKYPALGGVYCVMDGLKVPIQRPGDHPMQNAYNNGCLYGHFAGCIFSFAPDGLVVAASVINPGFWHDSFIAENSGTYEMLETIFNLTGEKCVVNSPFSLNHCPFLIKAEKELSASPTQTVMIMDLEATSLRQSTEWGMRGLKGSFPHLKEKNVYSDDCRD